MREILINILLAGLGLISISVGIALIYYVISSILDEAFSHITMSKEEKKKREDNLLLARIGTELIKSCNRGRVVEVKTPSTYIMGKFTEGIKTRMNLTDTSFNDITSRELSEFSKFF